MFMRISGRNNVRGDILHYGAVVRPPDRLDKGSIADLSSCNDNCLSGLPARYLSIFDA
ncbi:MAG: hypothetical protein WC291_07930 [Thermodesulfovibrionales bacterium]